ncbi:hypothetical protein ND748_10435 [Frankia sp. AiPs1]|uniref:hypothetical protein n=1 Tax=Frankia sp. AiPs1 TaxID=573493 RepID=UPI00204301C3|nr:hypothetical protein [Frankia sp. AiPs1]MCM3922074.1 hypothetical protein [Frankia sp. AiPs1]
MAGTERTRDTIATLLARDTAYDQDPAGDPPITVVMYRAAIRSVLAIHPAEPGPMATSWSLREQDVFGAGSRATLRAVIDALADALNGPTVDVTPASETPT